MKSTKIPAIAEKIYIAKEILGAVVVGMFASKLTIADGQIIHTCANEYTELVRLEAQGSCIAPDLRPLHSLLKRGSYGAAVAEAQAIRVAMAPMLEYAAAMDADQTQS